jgi:hypothetical protein
MQPADSPIYTGRRTHRLSLSPADWRMPEPVVSTDSDGSAAIALLPRMPEFSDDIKATLLGASCVRAYIDRAASDTRPALPRDYPQQSLAFILNHADVLEVRSADLNQEAPPDEVGLIEAAFNAPQTGKWVVRLPIARSCPEDVAVWKNFLEANCPPGVNFNAGVPAYDMIPIAN